MDNYEKYVGQIFDNRYRIERVIGIGGMAIVFKATDLLMRRVVAVKILKDEIAGDEPSVKRFINEYKAIAMLSHPNIVNIYDVSVRENIKYIVMEYVDGITLKNYMRHREVLNLREIVGYTTQILRALDHVCEPEVDPATRLDLCLVALTDLAPSDERIQQKVAAVLARFHITPAVLAERLFTRAGISTPQKRSTS